MSRDKEYQYVGDFINIYRNEHCLWKVKSKNYHDRSKRDVAYKFLVEKTFLILSILFMAINKPKVPSTRFLLLAQLKLQSKLNKKTEYGTVATCYKQTHTNLILF